MDTSELDARVELFSSMLLCCHDLYLWQYDSGWHLIKSNCPHEAAVNNLFTLLRGDDSIRLSPDGNDTPILMSNEIGMLWVLQPRFEGEELGRSYVLGPVFLDTVSPKNLEAQLSRRGMTATLREQARQFLNGVPVISLNRVFEYAIMLHHCVTGGRVGVNDLRYDDSKLNKATPELEETVSAHGTFEAEQEMLRIVREGDIANFRAQMDRISVTGRMGKLSRDDVLRQMKNAVITCLVLFSRAAMEGGLDPEVSYALSDRYFQSIEACRSVPDLVEIALPMQEDYVLRVHQCRTGGLSRPIQALCDYIDLHLEEPLDLASLAQRSGYAEYYLSRKFKKETGLAPSDYIRKKRLDRAAHLLRSTQEDIREIGARLQFCSQSHFSDSFRKTYGVTPSEYRAGASA